MCLFELRYVCVYNFIQVVVDGIWRACPEAGGAIVFSGFNGMISDMYYTILLNYIRFFLLWSRDLSYRLSCIVGELVFPTYHELCDDTPLALPSQCPRSRNMNGECIERKWHCFFGFIGDDCSTSKFLLLNVNELVSM